MLKCERVFGLSSPLERRMRGEACLLELLKVKRSVATKVSSGLKSRPPNKNYKSIAATIHYLNPIFNYQTKQDRSYEERIQTYPLYCSFLLPEN
jgi:hypothetical protein